MTDSAKHNPLCTFLAYAAMHLQHALSFVALLAVLILPAFKGLWIGYLPILVGGGIVALFLARPGFLKKAGDGLNGLSARNFILLIALLPALVQIVLILVVQSQPESDAKFVFQQAVHFAQTGEMSGLTRYAPMSIWWYALGVKLFGSSPQIAQLMLLPAAVGKSLFFYALMGEVLEKRRARLAAVACAFFPSTLVYILAMFYYFYLYTCLMAGMFLFWVRGQTGRTAVLPAAVAGVLGGLTALTLPTMLMASAQYLTLLVLNARKIFGFETWTRWLLFMLCFGLVLAPWMKRNYDVFGTFVPVCTAGGFIFYSANNPESNGLYTALEEPEDDGKTTPADYLAASSDYKDKAKAFILENPLAFLRLAVLKNLHTWGTDTTFLAIINWRGEANRWLDWALEAPVQTAWVMLVVLWALRSWRGIRAKEKPDLINLLVGVVVGSLWVVFSVLEGGARHHLPMIPLIILVIASPVRGRKTTGPEALPRSG